MTPLTTILVRLPHRRCWRSAHVLRTNTATGTVDAYVAGKLHTIPAANVRPPKRVSA